MAASEDRAAMLRRLHRIEGQVRGIAKMVEREEPCEDVLTQIAAARAALDRVGVYIISHRMRECVAGGEAAADATEAVEQALDAFIRFSRL
ncbi:MAG: metal-sensitive transcriptional regulator [Candidatus Geothermincolia bacterium]